MRRRSRRRDGFSDLRVGDAGLDGDAGVGEVDGEDAVHAGEADDDAAFGGERASAEACACSAGDEGDACFAQMWTTAWTSAVDSWEDDGAG